MNTNSSLRYFACPRKSFAGLAAALGLSVLATQSFATSSSEYYENALFAPSESMLLAETRGRITIYDGVANHQIEQALDNQFDRIERMMFVRIQYDDPDGSVDIDDDCD